MIRNFVIAFLLLVHLNGYAQTDSTAIAEEYDLEEQDTENSLYDGVSDSTIIDARNFDSLKLEALRADEELQYKQPPTVAESLWSRFLRFLSDFISGLFENAVSTNWGQMFSYLIGLVVLVLVIMLILKIDAFKIFYSGESASTMQYNVLDENIHELDFDSEIQNALGQKDYRRGVRLLFLYALKILSDKNYITWEQGKTNHDYVAEVKEEQLRKWLHQLSFYFDYAWYGNFAVSREMFDKVQGIFSDWKGRVK